MPVSFAGCPVSTPTGTTSSISMSTASPTRTEVPQALVAYVDGCPLHTKILTDQWRGPRHRTAERAREHTAKLLRLLVRRLVVDEHPEPPVAVTHHLGRVCHGRYRETTDIDAIDAALSDLKDESDLAESAVQTEPERC